MKKQQLLLFIVLTVALLYVWMKPFKEGFSASATTLVPETAIQEGQARYNDLMKLINIASPAVPLDAQTEKDFNAALGPEVKIKIPDGIPASFSKAASVCEKITSPDCTAFSNPDFAANCGISFDQKGTNSAGKPHMGGLYVDPTTRASKKPTFGTADPSKFVLDASTCQVVSETIACQTKQTFTSPNCAQCLTTSVFNRIDPATPRLTPTLNLQGSGTLTFQGQTYSLTSQTQQIQMNGIVEGSIYSLAVSGDPTSCYLAGYLSCSTAAGPYRIDLAALVDLDTATGYKPRQGGMQAVDSMQCTIMRPANGSGTMNLRGNLPFTFVSVSEADAAGCDNGPYITLASSANFLASDVCYTGSSAGNPSLACLQQKFIQVGGTLQGTGYPKSDADVGTLLKTIGASDLPTISNYLYDMAVKASTGRDSTGNQLAQADWNTASMFMTGVAITSPCAAATAGPLSANCLAYLYQNGGAGSSIGPTYTLGQQYASGIQNAPYCRPGANLDPATPTGLAKGQAAGSIQAVKSMYDQAHRTANDNTATPEARAAAIADCYGIALDASPAVQPSSTTACTPWSITSGGFYDSASGNISCFSGQTLQATQTACCSNSQCVGFSFNPPSGSGCYKKDTKAGFYTDPTYQGYYKAGVAI